MFEIVPCYDEDCNEIEMYWLKFNEILCDGNIAKKLGISTLKYRNILRKFGARKHNDTDELFFFNKKEIENALNYLNDTYVIFYKLNQ